MTAWSPAPPHPADGLVTIAIPTYNGARYLRSALESAVRQTYESIEILVVDDVSADGSVEIAEQFRRDHPGRPIRVERNQRRLGLAPNWNRCVDLAHGEYIKFLFQDDLIEPECVAELVTAIEQSPAAVMAFSRRNIIVDGPRDFSTRLWLARHSIIHARFRRIERLNSGPQLFREQAARDPFRNWIGEPTAVLLRTESVRATGGFNPRLRQLADVEMWLRIMCRGQVAFVDQPLATFRLHTDSTTFSNVRDGAAWLDPLWLAEGLASDACTANLGPSPVRLRVHAILRVVRAEVLRLVRAHPPAIWRRAGEIREWWTGRTRD